MNAHTIQSQTQIKWKPPVGSNPCSSMSYLKKKKTNKIRYDDTVLSFVSNLHFDF